MLKNVENINIKEGAIMAYDAGMVLKSELLIGSCVEWSFLSKKML